MTFIARQSSQKLAPIMKLVCTVLLAFFCTSFAQDCVDCPEYVALPASEKYAVIEKKIMDSQYKHIPKIKGICDVTYDWRNDLDFNSQFDRFSDERSPGMERFFHFNGMTAMVELVVPDDTTFTGIFAGASHGVLRFSPLAPLLKQRFLTHHFIGTFFYAFALKFFRDGMHSANILTGETAREINKYAESRSFYDKPDFNIFSRTVDNASGIGSNGATFGVNEALGGAISVADVASYTQDGQEVESVKAPIIVQFAPNAEVAERFGQVHEIDFRKWVPKHPSVFKAGLVLYKMYTTVDATSDDATLCLDDDQLPVVDSDELVSAFCPDQKRVWIGDVVLKDEFRVSEWGDEGLFFQHTRFCPKDQQLCQSSVAGLQQPLPWLAQDNDQLCISGDDRSGALTGILPDCPNDGTPLADYCYPGMSRQVEDTQILQCPFIQQVNPTTLGTDGQEPTVTDCDLFSRASSGLFGWILSVISGIIRFFTFPFTIFKS